MRIEVLGGGPAGLYLAYLARRRLGDVEVCVHERNAPDATFGFGVVLAGRGLAKLAAADAESHALIAAMIQPLGHQEIRLEGEAVSIEGPTYGGAIRRLDLLRTLRELCEGVGVTIRYHDEVDDPAGLDAADLVVGADGANSTLRAAHEQAFGTHGSTLTNRFAWYGAELVHDRPTLSFRRAGEGAFCAHYYPYTDSMCTFVMECDAAAWRDCGFEAMDEPARRGFCEALYADELKGAPLVSNNSSWRCFEPVRNRSWVHGHRVLIGDAVRRAHFSIGSGTRIAMEDAIALVDALATIEPDGPSGKPIAGTLEAALARYVDAREPAAERLLSAAEQSYTWYEDMATHMRGKSVRAFALDFLTRTERVDADRVSSEYPDFMAALDAEGVENNSGVSP